MLHYTHTQIPHLYPCICWWAYSSFHVLAIVNSLRCYEHWGPSIFLNYTCVSVYAQNWDCKIHGNYSFRFFEEPSYCFQVVAPVYTPPPPVLHTPSSMCYLYTSFSSWLLPSAAVYVPVPSGCSIKPVPVVQTLLGVTPTPGALEPPFHPFPLWVWAPCPPRTRTAPFIILVGSRPNDPEAELRFIHPNQFTTCQGF